eukprot:1151618-Pelagomonas_calceolata.AAC.3
MPLISVTPGVLTSEEISTPGYFHLSHCQWESSDWIHKTRNDWMRLKQACPKGCRDGFSNLFFLCYF